MDIKQYLRDHNVDFTVGTHPPQFTSQEVAAAEHVPGREMAKVVIVRSDGRFVMTVLPATKVIDLARLNEILGSEYVRLAEEYEMQELFPDVEVGAEPPFGNLYNLPVIIDRELTENEHIVFQSGSHREAVRIRMRDYERLVGPLVGNFAKAAEAEAPR